jgi:hypothetical protein
MACPSSYYMTSNPGTQLIERSETMVCTWQTAEEEGGMAYRGSLSAPAGTQHQVR